MKYILATWSTDLFDGPQKRTWHFFPPSCEIMWLILSNRHTSLIPVYVFPVPVMREVQGLDCTLYIFFFVTVLSLFHHKPLHDVTICSQMIQMNGQVIGRVYGDVIYKLRKILGQVLFENRFNKRIKSFIKNDYDPVILQRTSRLVIDPSTVNSHAFLFGCAVTDMVQYMYSMMVYL